MKKVFVLMAFASALLLAGCTKEEDRPGGDTPDKWSDWDPSRYLTGFTMSAEELGTKASVNFSDGAVTWNDGDKVLVFVPGSRPLTLMTERVSSPKAPLWRLAQMWPTRIIRLMLTPLLPERLRSLCLIP